MLVLLTDCLTLFPLALFEGIEDIYEGEVIALWVLKLSVTQSRLMGHTRRRLQEAARCYKKTDSAWSAKQNRTL